MRIHFAIQCHNFQHRLCWQLSSILQQVSANTEIPSYIEHEPIPQDLGTLPEIIIDVAYMPNNGRPTTESVIDHFRSLGLHIEKTEITDREVFAKRGLVRNIQIKNAINSDWIFFADCDNVYHPHFFCKLARELEKLDTRKCVYSVEKIHTEVEPTNAVMSQVFTNKTISRAYEKASALPDSGKSNKNVASGCMQVVKTENVNIYVNPEECRDHHLFNRGQRARSDIQFRRRMGGQHRIYLPTQIHLNHSRDKEARKHLEEQR